ncbi:MAG: DHH family phosphoesterase [Nanoarchaeota archaeon]
MEKERDILKEQIKRTAEIFLEKTENKDILVISHFDTDGITSAAIMIKTLKKLDKTFSLRILKSLEEETMHSLPRDKIILFLDLASNSLDYIESLKLENVFIIDHHEIIKSIPDNIYIVNPELNGKEKLSASSLTYLFCKELDFSSKEFAKLAILGMIGDRLEKNIDRMNNEILNYGEIIKKRGLLIYPSTRPINRTLEFGSNPYIPGVTGNIKGVLSLLREINLKPDAGKYKSILEMNEKEMSDLVTAIMLRKPKAKPKDIIGDIFLIKMFGKLEDARELSAMINACSRLGEPETAIQLCLEIPESKKRAEAIHVKYKQEIISGLNFVSKTEKIKENNYVIINAKNEIKDTIIGTIASILSSSSIYEEGTTIIAMAFDEKKEKIKISSRNVGEIGRNVREILNDVVKKIGGEVGGHEFAAGCLIKREYEEDFLKELIKNLEIEVVKV